MPTSEKPMLAVYAAAALAIALIGARYLKSSATDGAAGGARTYATAARAPGASGATSRTSNAIVVHVAGAVRHPGVVRLRVGARVADALVAAGGPARGANVEVVNLAMLLADGQQVIVPRRGAAAGGGPGTAGGATGPISLNAASAEQLDTLDGVGPGIAEKIVAYRTQHGGFRSLDELGEVPGIGEKRLESLKGQLQP